MLEKSKLQLRLMNTIESLSKKRDSLVSNSKNTIPSQNTYNKLIAIYEKRLAELEDSE